MALKLRCLYCCLFLVISLHLDLAGKRRVDELSDDEACKDACNVGEYCLGADLTTDDWDTFKYSLRAPCPCALRRQIQDQSCYDVFQKNNALQEELRRERAHFKSMHKLDQDRLLFDKLRELAYSQGILVRNELGKLAVQGTLNYFFLGQPICRLGFAHLYGVSWAPRLTTIYNAVLAGAGSAPVDHRFLSREHASPAHTASEVYSYLVELWHSVAEGLPEGDRRLGKKDLEWEPSSTGAKHMEDDINEHDPYADIEAAGEPIRGPSMIPMILLLRNLATFHRAPSRIIGSNIALFMPLGARFLRFGKFSKDGHLGRSCSFAHIFNMRFVLCA